MNQNNEQHILTAGTATPEGGNQPGVSIKLTAPVISLFGKDLQNYGDDIREDLSFNRDCISAFLYVDLMKADGTVTESSLYSYDDLLIPGYWKCKSGSDCLTVNGGEGVYYMRAVVRLHVMHSMDLSKSSVRYTCYSGTATVSADGQFCLNGPLQPYNTAVTFTLKDSDGQLLKGDEEKYYNVAPTGIAVDQQLSNGNIIEWTDDSTRPKYALSTVSCTYEKGNHSDWAYSLAPGIVPNTWYEDEEDYDPLATPDTPDKVAQGSQEVLFSVNLCPQGFLNPMQTWIVKRIGPSQKFTLEVGKHYHFTLRLSADGPEAFIDSIEEFDSISLDNYTSVE